MQTQLEEQNLIITAVKQNIRDNLISEIDNGSGYDKHYSYEKALEMFENYLKNEKYDCAENFIRLISNYFFYNKNNEYVGPGVIFRDYGMSKEQINKRDRKIFKRLKQTMTAVANGKHVHNKERTTINGVEITNLAESFKGETSSEESESEKK